MSFDMTSFEKSAVICEKSHGIKGVSRSMVKWLRASATRARKRATASHHGNEKRATSGWHGDRLSPFQLLSNCLQ